MHAIPGDPFTQEKAIPEEILKAMQKHYGLDKSLIAQYFEYMRGILQLDLGPSFKYQGRTVNAIIREGFPVSLCLGLEALFLSLFFGTLLGSISASKQGKWQDRSTMFLAILGLSVPSFLLATFLQYLFAIKLDLFPVARWGTFRQSILPALSLSALPTAFIARLLRASMIEVLHQDYIQTAKSKGLSTFSILYKHVLRNALMPVLSYLGPLTASILTGSFAVEKIFGIPGLGQWFVLSITNRDYTVIMGTTLFYSVLLMISVFLVDLVYSWIDPRIQTPMKRGIL
jgi:oligopeptide transport system permease protein